MTFPGLPAVDATNGRENLAPANGVIVQQVSTAASLDLTQFAGRPVRIKVEGAAGERLGYIAWRAGATAGQLGENAAPNLTATTGAGRCDAIDTGQTVRRLVDPAFPILRVIASTGTLTVRVVAC